MRYGEFPRSQDVERCRRSEPVACCPPAERLRRREWLMRMGLGALGLAPVAPILAEASRRSTGRAQSSISGRSARSCIFIFLYGGPSQLDTWDLKPGAPAQIRGEFQPIETSVPGTHICEHLPRLAQLASRYTIVRSLQHNNRNHAPSSGWTLTGANPHTTDDPKKRPTINDPPALGSLASWLAPSGNGLPPFVQLPARLYFDAGLYFLGQAAGWLGTKYDPVLIQQDPNDAAFRVEEFAARREVPSGRWTARAGLLSHFADGPSTAAQVRMMAEYQQSALEMLRGESARAAFELAAEPATDRDRYGRTMLGQSCLLARRLVEAGVRWVTVADCAANGLHQWDTHAGNFAALRNLLLPRIDQAASALLEDLAARGLLDETVVFIGGEFGRTPRIGERSAGGAEPDGRDHWSECYTGLLAGGGIHAGQVYGASDRHAAYPSDAPVSPDDLGATILRAMGLDPATPLRAFDGRPVFASQGTPVAGLLSK